MYSFVYGYDNEEQKKFAEQGLETHSMPRDGIQGPIFGVRTKTLDKLPKEWLLIEPQIKNEGCGMERRWSLMFHLVGASKYYLIHKDLLDFSNRTFIDKYVFNRL